MEHWANKYIGIPFLMGGNSIEEGFDCWGLFRHIQREQFNRSLPAVCVPEYDRDSVSSLMNTHTERQNWVETSVPEDGGAILMAHARWPVHVGLCVSDSTAKGILHTERGVGARFTAITDLSATMWKITGVYRYVG